MVVRIEGPMVIEGEPGIPRGWALRCDCDRFARDILLDVIEIACESETRGLLERFFSHPVVDENAGLPSPNLAQLLGGAPFLPGEIPVREVECEQVDFSIRGEKLLDLSVKIGDVTGPVGLLVPST